MHDFKKLKVWQKSRQLVKEVYLLTKKFPKDELFGLTSQVRRAVISIPSNIAEGCGRNTNKDTKRFVDIAQGSSFEVETQIILAYDLDYISKEEVNIVWENINEVQKMLRGFGNTLKN
ncbi:MAG: four helix bundle protein [Saprospiraceae bacterium]